MPNAREVLARDAVRAGLHSAGIDHDHIEGIADRIVDALREADLLPLSYKEILGPLDPEATVTVQVAVWPARMPGGDGDVARSRAQAERLAQALQEVYGGSVEDRPYVGHRSVYGCTSTPTSGDIVEYIEHAVYYDGAVVEP